MNSRGHIVRAFFVGALSIMLPFVASAEGDPVDETKEVSSTGHVTVNVVRGEVRLVGWNKSAVQVTGTLDTGTKEFIFDVNGDETIIEVKIDSNRNGWFGSDEGSDLIIYLPASSRMEFSGVSTDVEARGLDKSIEVSVVSGDVDMVGGPSRVSVQTVSGDLFLKDSTGRVKVATVSGDIVSSSVTGEARYTSVSGDIVVEGGGEEVLVETVSGDIEVVNGSVKTLGGHSVSGDITVNTRLLDEGSIEFANISGNIELQLEGDISARFDLETGSGSIRNKLSKEQPAISRYMGDESLQFTVGEGEGQVILSTRSGNLLVEARP
jgi:DUF4097 and DUF4098 domain-containing protein YvlB